MSGKISQAFYNDILAAKKSNKQATQVKVSYITKAGKPSRIKADWKFFDTVSEAQAYCDDINSRCDRVSYSIVS